MVWGVAAADRPLSTRSQMWESRPGHGGEPDRISRRDPEGRPPGSTAGVQGETHPRLPGPPSTALRRGKWRISDFRAVLPRPTPSPLCSLMPPHVSLNWCWFQLCCKLQGKEGTVVLFPGHGAIASQPSFHPSWKPPARAHSRMEGVALPCARLHIRGWPRTSGDGQELLSPTLQIGHSKRFCNTLFPLQNSPSGVPWEGAAQLPHATGLGLPEKGAEARRAVSEPRIVLTSGRLSVRLGSGDRGWAPS